MGAFRRGDIAFLRGLSGNPQMVESQTLDAPRLARLTSSHENRRYRHRLHPLADWPEHFPGALLHFKDEEFGVVIGRLICVGCEIVGGGLLIFLSVRGIMRDQKKRR